MTISPYGASALAVANATASFASQKSTLASLQQQLSTGQKAPTYSGLGASASTSLKLNTKLATVAGYGRNIADATLRVKLMSAGLTQVQTLASSLTTSLPSAAGHAVGLTASETSADDGMKQVIDVMNSEVNGRYLFAGRSASAAPVASYDRIMNGDTANGLAGARQVIAERQAADLGDGKGRLTVATSGTTATLAEDAAGSPFGFKIASAAATGTGITAVATTATSPASAAISVSSQPDAGDTVSVVLDLPDGTSTTLNLVAGASTAKGDDGNAYFAIGATPADTAANLAAAFTTKLQTLAGTTLSSASAVRGAQDFFADPPQRVAGATPAAATALAAGTAADTVGWYTGETSSAPRATQPVQIGDDQTIGIGAEANEAPLRAVLVNMAALAASTFPTSDTTSVGRYTALRERVVTNLTFPDEGPSVNSMVVDLSGASKSLSDASASATTATNQIQDTLGAIEDADPNETATKLLAIQTQLSATYQTIATISKMSLVNFL